ncbi:protein of unknown function [Taphrina deformans PYCC 5710]|uniref:Myb-like domain-containing protein n=1 Tax=Taphrina deformans (strain PYCC 5710 / ATCC 11124 / CBS 356.35 / IMI 108563 / JCM 9778 / NBRC 8474) TaxID=1097556 RepID=R4XFE0_TAPDE|nr:protein of unknown function [Taphrina deformans PYCC 5710]|eukprot:CCG84589.1 protein of unknown function [Taphrina deformans PYCC 5710]
MSDIEDQVVCELPRTPQRKIKISSARSKNGSSPFPTITSPSKSTGYTVADDLLIMTLRGSGMSWEEGTSPHDRVKATAVRLHHDKVLRSMNTDDLAKLAAETGDGSKGYTPDQDRLIMYLKEVKKLKWSEMEKFFSGKTSTALRLHYAKLKKVIS